LTDKNYNVTIVKSLKENLLMNEFIADKLMEDFMLGELTPEQAWKNLQEFKDSIPDERFDEICLLITESLVDSERVEEDEEIDLEDFFSEDDIEQQLEWFDKHYINYEPSNPNDEDDWTSGNDIY
jgi:hypothetical protein